MLGKVSKEELEKLILPRIGALREDVDLGPKYGEDAAAVKVGNSFLVVSSDPLIFAAKEIGKLAVNVACNDVAACGARPRWMLNTILLPEGSGELDRITGQVNEEAKKLGISVIGGHTEYTPEISRPFLSMTCFGLTEKYVPSSGARPGEKIILTKGAAVEGTGIIATDFEGELKGKVDEEIIERAKSKMEEISVVEDAMTLSNYASSMHDPTEGGLVDGLLEMADASGVGFVVEEEKIRVAEETERVCGAVGVDPLKIFSSGSLVATVPEDKAAKALEELSGSGISASVIGEVIESEIPRVEIGDMAYEEPVRDELYDKWG